MQNSLIIVQCNYKNISCAFFIGFFEIMMSQNQTPRLRGAEDETNWTASPALSFASLSGNLGKGKWTKSWREIIKSLTHKKKISCNFFTKQENYRTKHWKMRFLGKQGNSIKRLTPYEAGLTGGHRGKHMTTMPLFCFVFREGLAMYPRLAPNSGPSGLSLLCWDYRATASHSAHDVNFKRLSENIKEVLCLWKVKMSQTLWHLWGYTCNLSTGEAWEGGSWVRDQYGTPRKTLS